MLSNKEIWSIITGRSSLLQPEEISKVVSEYKEKLCNGLEVYKTPSDSSREKVKKSASAKRLDLIIKLSELMNLDACQADELFQAFIRTEFRGTSQQLKNALDHSAMLEDLILQLIKFYFKERLFLLKCIQYILSYWQDPVCLFRAEFAAQVDDMVNQGFIDKIFKQLKNLCNGGMVHSGIKGNMQFEEMFAYQGTVEQCGLLQIIFLYYKDFEFSGDKLIDMANFLQSINFGMKQPDRKHLGSSSIDTIQPIGYLCCMILLEGIDLQFLDSVQRNESALIDHHIFGNRDFIQKLDDVYIKWDAIEPQSPILLAWSIVRYYVKSSQDEFFEEFGKRAAAFDVFGYLLALVQWAASSTNEVVSHLVKCIVHTLFDQTFLIFHEDSFGNSEVILQLVREIAGISELPRNLLDQDKKTGIGIHVESTKKQFPYMLCPFVDILASSVNDADSAANVFNALNRLSWLTERLEDNMPDELGTTESSMVQMRITDKSLVSSGIDSIIVPAGALGIISQLANGMHLIRWNISYSCWDYLTLEMKTVVEEAFDYLTSSGENVVKRLTSIFNLVKKIIEMNWQKAEALEDLISGAMVVLKRFSSIPSPPLELLGLCLEIMTIVAKEIPEQVMDQLLDIGFLPECQDVAASLKDTDFGSLRFSAGKYGILLRNAECEVGCFQVSKSYLKLLKVFCESLDYSGCVVKFQHIVANLIFVVQEIFADIPTWKFADPADKVELVELSLALFHFLLASRDSQMPSSTTSKYNLVLCALLGNGILNGDAGETLLTVLSIGVDSISYPLYEISSNKNARTDLIQTVKLGLAVLERLIFTNKASSITRLENTICTTTAFRPFSTQFFQEDSSMITVIAKYIYHDDDPKLAILAILVLQRLCAVSPISVIACFGNEAPSLRRAIISRLGSDVEPIRLKIAILELLTSAVETQPGLVEFFLHQRIHTGLDASSKEQQELGRFSCIPAVLRFLDTKRKNYPLVLKLSSLRFLHALWENRMDSTMSVVRERENFWSNLVRMATELKIEKLTHDIIDLWSIVLQILTLEIYYISRETFDAGLKEAIEIMQNSKFHKEVLNILKSKYGIDEHKKAKIVTSLQILIRAWTNYLIIGTSLHPAELYLDKDDIKQDLLLDVFTVFQSLIDRKLHGELSCSVMLLTKQWACYLRNHDQLMKGIIKLIKLLCVGDDEPNKLDIQDNLFSAVLVVANSSIESNAYERIVDEDIITILPMVCKCIQDISVQDFSEDRKEKIEKLLLLTNLLSFSARCLKNKVTLCNILDEYSILSYLMDTLRRFIKDESYKKLVNGILSMCLIFAEYNQLGEMTVSNNLLQILVIDLSWQCTSSIRPDSVDETWSLSVSIITTLLKTLSHTVIEEVIAFIGAHKERIIQATNLTLRITAMPLLEESKEIAKLLLLLSNFRTKLEMMQPELMLALKSEAMTMLHTSAAFLARPRLLRHLVESQDKDSVEALLETARAPSVSLSCEAKHSSLLKEELFDKLAGSAVLTQEILIQILACVTGMVKGMAPNFLETILDEGMDFGGFSPLLNLAFNSPSLEDSSMVSFGTFISCINTAQRFLQQIASAESPSSSPLPDKQCVGLRGDAVRTTLTFIIENSLIIMMSEAACYLRHPAIHPRTKQFLKRELGSEMRNFLSSISRQFSRRSSSQGLKSSDRRSPSGYRRSPSKLAPFSTDDDDYSIYKIAYTYASQMLK